ncbi:MAG: alpha/beta hydrolase [Paracoccaceae bacterium]
MTEFLTTPQGRRLAFNRLDSGGPGVVFLSGFASDMEGTKAVWLNGWSQARGRGFLRFDYSGHGRSSGAFTDGCIGDWFEDALAALQALTTGPQVLVGSSMGGWIALLLARALPERVAGMTLIAAAPDFTEDSLRAGLSPAERSELDLTGAFRRPSPYGAPQVFTRRLIEEGRSRLVLREPLRLPFPVRLLQGTADQDVPPSVALRLLNHADCPDMALTLVKGADHRFSSPDCLARIAAGIDEVTAAARAR